MQDTTDDEFVTSLELERIKNKIKDVWNHALVSQYETDKSSSNTEKPLPVLEEYLAMYALKFPGDVDVGTEADGLLALLEDIMSSDEDLDPVNKEAHPEAEHSCGCGAQGAKGSVEMKLILDKEEKFLTNLIKRRNKEFGVIL